MERSGQEGTAAPVFHEAVQWVEKIRRRRADEIEFLEWASRSPAHVEEFFHAWTIWDGIAELTPEMEARIEAQSEKTVRNVIIGLFDRPDTLGEPSQVPTLTRMVRIAALGLLVAVGIPSEGSQRYFVTAVGQTRLVRLMDGSAIHLNTDTRLRVSFANGLRSVEMERGEALFDVAKDETRPFVVNTSLASAHALGTSFDVRQEPDRTTVSVLEGRVRVSGKEDSTAANSAVELTAGEDAKVTRAAQPLAIDVQKRGMREARARVAWTQGRLEFLGETLQEAVNEMNRYNDIRIRIHDPDLARKQISGTFDIGDPKGFAAALAQPLDATVSETVQVGSGRIVIEIQYKNP
jgi:transmembrane sensor